MAYNQYCSDGKWPFGGEGEPDDIPVPDGEAAEKISEILAAADAGEYTFGGCADTLPALPGLYIDGVGLVSPPLTQEQATVVIAKCQKSPFGHNMDTKMDESVRKSWQLSPDQVQMKNPSWQTGMEKLTETIGDRLGYKGIKLQCVLYKLLVYEEGGHFLKHQDTEKEDRMIATLVIQPPSTHEGGDLVVYRNGEVASRHDFGKSEGTAAFFNHYAVHYADAEHALEKVTKGYRLALVYSICLPIEMQNLKRNPDSVVTDLSGVIRDMDVKEFALLLSHEYTEKSIEEMGCGALKGIDHARFRALEEANALVPDDKKLRYFLAKLSQDIDSRLDEDGWSNWIDNQALHWYSTCGGDFGRFTTRYYGETELDFLNPGRETLLEFWKAYGTTGDVYTGNEGVVRRTTYCRFAIVVWPESKYIRNIIYFMPPESAAELVAAHKPVDIAMVKNLLETASWKNKWGENDYTGNARASLRFSRTVCDLLLDTDDVNLVTKFFTEYCVRLGYLEGSETMLPSLMKIIQKFGWSFIGEAVLAVLKNTEVMVLTEGLENPKLLKVGGFEYDSSAELLLQVADGFSEGEEKRSIVQTAIENGLDVRSTTAARILWEYATSHTEIIKDVVTNLELKEPHELVPFTECFSQYIADLDEEDETFTKLHDIAAKRCVWLREEIQRFEKPFTWEMPYAKETKDEIQAFLRGPDESLKFPDDLFLNAANRLAKQCSSPWHASVMVEVVPEEYYCCVKFTKTRKWYEDEKAKILEYKSELELLDKLDKPSHGRKKPRLSK